MTKKPGKKPQVTEQQQAAEELLSQVCQPPSAPSQPAVPEGKTICPRCRALSDADSFFCYACGKYFAEAEEIKPAEGAKKQRPDKTAQAAPRARITMPGGSEIVLSGAPTFIERSDFDGALPQDVLMSISRQHLLITCDSRTYYVQDYGRDGTGSTNHTRLNSVDIYHKGRQPLKDGDQIELSSQPELTLTFRLS
ncbi:MAG: FHA domain-containing protein [Dehalococcoidia bacterium]|nr:FHA domain-containing protein [Dehalococcoidia bacterium]MDD5493701.1 FHA domain-containing protein [Dehalococcoidia bacterium]